MTTPDWTKEKDDVLSVVIILQELQLNLVTSRIGQHNYKPYLLESWKTEI